MGLTGHEPGTFKISLRFKDKEEWLLRDVVARTDADISIKIRPNESWKQINPKEVGMVL